MSTVRKQSNGTESQFSSYNETIRCPADAILNGLTDEYMETKCISKSRVYNSILEYCNDAADELPERQAFYVIDLADVLWKVQEWKKSMPKVDMFYAVKANTDPVVLQLLSKLGLSFDCASGAEIQMVLDAGASPSNIIFAHTIKTTEELKFASNKGVELMTFDNKDELHKICRVYSNAKLLIRISPDSVNCSFDLSDKFGCTKNEAINLLQLARQLKLNVVGVSFHVGALCNDPNSYASTIRTSRYLFDAAREMGFTFSILDIGGGFYGEVSKQDIFYTMANSINQALDEYFSNDQVRIIAEPGTYIAGSASALLCTVLGRRCFDNAVEGHPKRHYYLNDGVYGSFFRGIDSYGIEPIPTLTESEVQSRPKYASRIFGQTCCSEDVILRNVVLPDLKIGERILWTNMGAYSLGVCSTFCGVLLPVPKYIFKQDPRLNLDWIISKTNIENLLKKHAVYIEHGTDEI